MGSYCLTEEAYETKKKRSMGNQMVSSEIREYFHARFVQNQLIS